MRLGTQRNGEHHWVSRRLYDTAAELRIWGHGSYSVSARVRYCSICTRNATQFQGWRCSGRFGDVEIWGRLFWETGIWGPPRLLPKGPLDHRPRATAIQVHIVWRPIVILGIAIGAGFQRRRDSG
jgi:hypothetical protein